MYYGFRKFRLPWRNPRSKHYVTSCDRDLTRRHPSLRNRPFCQRQCYCCNVQTAGNGPLKPRSLRFLQNNALEIYTLCVFDTFRKTSSSLSKRRRTSCFLFRSNRAGAPHATPRWWPQPVLLSCRLRRTISVPRSLLSHAVCTLRLLDLV